MILGTLFRVGSLVDYQHRGSWHTGIVRAVEGDELFIEARNRDTVFRFYKKISEVRSHGVRRCVERASITSHQRDNQGSGSKTQARPPVEMAG